ncbi:uncharacterized protein LOC134347761 [Mobula hypostoma]|uniref:uncharacterized protein LOC134347761 n=1 Tax=Mobula hypostoma TaxID=723540 RepID=UPI002FC2C79C
MASLCPLLQPVTDWNADHFFNDVARSDEGKHLLQDVELNCEEAEIGTLKRLQMLVRGRKSHNAEDAKKIASPHAAGQDLEDRTPVGSLQQPQSKFQPKSICSENRYNQSELDPGWDFSYPWPRRAHTLGWYQMPDVLSPWDLKQHTCWRRLQDSVGPRWSATLPRERVWSPLCCPHACHCQAFPSSFTDTNLSDPLISGPWAHSQRCSSSHNTPIQDTEILGLQSRAELLGRAPAVPNDGRLYYCKEP